MKFAGKSLLKQKAGKGNGGVMENPCRNPFVCQVYSDSGLVATLPFMASSSAYPSSGDVKFALWPDIYVPFRQR